MWNVRFVKPYLSQDTLIKSAVLLSVNARQEQLVLGNIRTQKKGKNVLEDGIRVQQELKLKKNIEVSQKLKNSELLELNGTAKNIQTKKDNGTKSMDTEVGDITLDILIGKQLKENLTHWETNAFIVDALKELKQTISFLYQKLEQIMWTIYSHYVSGVMLRKGIGYEL